MEKLDFHRLIVLIWKRHKEMNFDFQGNTNVFCITKHITLKIRYAKYLIRGEMRC